MKKIIVCLSVALFSCTLSFSQNQQLNSDGTVTTDKRNFSSNQQPTFQQERVILNADGTVGVQPAFRATVVTNENPSQAIVLPVVNQQTEIPVITKPAEAKAKPQNGMQDGVPSGSVKK